MTHRLSSLSAPLALSLLVACGGDLGELPTESSRTELRLTPTDDEQTCTAPDHVFATPRELLDADGRCDPEREAYCLRLAPELRAFAADATPLATLAEAARRYDAYLEGDDAALASARALSDLAVTGQRSYARFAAAPPRPLDLADAASPEAVEWTLERAYDVAWALRGPAAARAELRPGLGYVAVSGEDDLPDRPVNVPGASHPVTDAWLDVPLGDGTIRRLRTRVVIASTELVEEPAPVDRVGRVPAPLPLAVPETGDVIVFLHGHSSLAEEGAGLLDALVANAAERGDALTVLAYDLPSNGYAERLDPSIVIGADGGRDDAVLRFLDRTVVAFVDALEAATPGTRARIRAVIGGSLGGNLVLRLGESPGVTWPTRLVAWSPASIDFSWAHADWPLAAGSGEYVDIVKHEAVRMTRGASEEPEDDASRAHYFTGGLTSVRNQASYWYRESWAPCRERTIDEGLVQLGEVYDARFRRWHYRVAFEQLVFSHLEPDAEGEPRRFRRIALPLLLVTGAEDDSVPMQTFTFVERLSPHLEAPGETLFLEDTGHALHTERPALLAARIEAFALETGPTTP
ncbi:MAG: alpha/beta hydrolase [Sandaracinaceae bacterium]|nr:alpha/beta hydrolase [Sandaracinaceae bacterium]